MPHFALPLLAAVLRLRVSPSLDQGDISQGGTHRRETEDAEGRERHCGSEWSVWMLRRRRRSDAEKRGSLSACKRIVAMRTES